jgi:hypothetical protein
MIAKDVLFGAAGSISVMGRSSQPLLITAHLFLVIASTGKNPFNSPNQRLGWCICLIAMSRVQSGRHKVLKEEKQDRSKYLSLLLKKFSTVVV